MTIREAPFEPIGGLRVAGRFFRNIYARLRCGSTARPLLTAGLFQEELVVLGLSGKRFGPWEYLEALEEYLGISIEVHVIPDASYPELSRRLALSGQLGELRYSERARSAAILLPESLPPLVLNLTVLHELGHLAAGDLLVDLDGERAQGRPEHGDGVLFGTSCVKPGKKLARGLPLADENLRELEANLRASYALIAGSLGGESPYAHQMNDIL